MEFDGQGQRKSNCAFCVRGIFECGADIKVWSKRCKRIYLTQSKFNQKVKNREMKLPNWMSNK